jgi:microcystin-dependent protein
MAFTDFPNGITSANDYLTNNISLDAQLSSSVANIGRFMIKPELDSTLREIICSLLAGRGLKLPNIQICISLNLKELLGIGALQQTLYDVLNKLDQAVDRFMDHLKIDEVLGRINSVLGQISTIANMINFCSAPIDPIAIPNVLGSAMESFLGKGKELIDRLGTIVPDQIGGCLIDGFNCDVWSGGIMQTLGNNCDAINNGTLDNSIIDSIVAEVDDLIADIDNLIGREQDIATNYDQGGSDLAETPRSTNTGMGPLFNAEDEGIAQCETYANQLYAIHQATEGYVLTDTDGNSFQGPLSLICDDDLLRLLRQPPNPTPQIAEQVPVFSYCGEIVGYQQVETQSDQDASVGLVPGEIDQPGFNAGGILTNPVREAQTEETQTTQTTSSTTSLTGAQIKTAYEAEADTNAFTDAEKTKLAEAGTAALMADSADTDLNNDPDAALRRDIAKVYIDTLIAAAAAGVPTGALFWMAKSTPPTGYLECDGSAISRSTYAALFAEISDEHGVGDGSTTFNLPDLRGEFVRGWDNGRGVDGSRAFGSAQADALDSHSHTVTLGGSSGSGSIQANTASGNIGSAPTSSTGGTETRPRNIALLPVIKI